MKNDIVAELRAGSETGLPPEVIDAAIAEIEMLRGVISDIKTELSDYLPSDDPEIRRTPTERLAHAIYLIAMR